MSYALTPEEKELKKVVKKHLSLSHQATLDHLLAGRNMLLAKVMEAEKESVGRLSNPDE